ncbi:MAG: lytic transglycosylase domain-containing protein [Rhodospirillaceae bacterium]|nr:lytic transglycosylase domain-containing protein [Rhodospirillaceae bacterium]
MSIASLKPAISVAEQGVPSNVTAAVRYASDKAGVDFSYLLAKAAAESGFRADAKARTSSATGLFQFVEETWLDMIEQHGAKYGLVHHADSLREGTVDPAMKERILALRENPRLSALMAAEYTRANQTVLEREVGGEIGETELYMAHFLGAGGAARFLAAMADDPSGPAADILPRAAHANRDIFYERDAARSLAAVYGDLQARMVQADATARAATAPKSHDASQELAALPVRARARAGAAAPLPRTFLPPLAMETQLFLAKLPIPGESRTAMA